MKFPAAGYLLFIQMISINVLCAQETTSFKKSIFYSVMEAGNEDAINKQLQLLKTITMNEKEAYEGALLMKKAGIAGGPQKKLKLFKEGHKKLEAILKKDSSNVEFRFLRFMIQEHAPGILGYKGDLGKDKVYIKNNFKKLPVVVQEAVIKYSKVSKMLQPEDL